MPDFSSLLGGQPGQSFLDALVNGKVSEGYPWANKAADVASKVPYNMLMQLATLPQRAIQNSQYSLDTGNYDPAAPVEAAMLPMGTGAIAGVPVKGAETVLGAGPVRAYHGSPHDFDAFSMDKIGTGEGAQAYGHGLYFAGNENVARSYRDMLSPSTMTNAEDLADQYLSNAGGDRRQALNAVHSTVAGLPRGHALMPDHQEALNLLYNPDWAPPKSAGHMYEVNIDSDPEHFLDWDKPLKDQPHIMEAVKTLGPDVANRVARESRSPGKQLSDIIANEHLPLGQATDANISAVMHQAGIPGIKYLDQGSRAAGDGSRNYVIFNDKLIDIVKKYAAAGIALPPAIAAQYEQMNKSGGG